MVTPRLILILGDQLSPDMAALRAADITRDYVVMAEVMAEGTSVPHHPQKIALILTAMRKFAAHLRIAGWRVLYSDLDDPQNSQTISGELLRRAVETGAQSVLAARATVNTCKGTKNTARAAHYLRPCTLSRNGWSAGRHLRRCTQAGANAYRLQA